MDDVALIALLYAVRLWETNTGRETRRFRGDALNFAFSPDSVWLAGIDRAHSSFTLWKLQ